MIFNRELTTDRASSLDVTDCCRNVDERINSTCSYYLLIRRKASIPPKAYGVRYGIVRFCAHCWAIESLSAKAPERSTNRTHGRRRRVLWTSHFTARRPRCAALRNGGRREFHLVPRERGQSIDLSVHRHSHMTHGNRFP